MKQMIGRSITWLLLLFILIVLFNIYILVRDRDKIYENIEANVFSKVIDALPVPKDGKDGYTPVKGVDYFDGRDGRDGRDGINGTNGVDGAQGIQGEKGTDGTNGQNGLTPQIRCNTKKNQWEVRYSDTDNWSLLNNERVKCTPTGGL